MKRPSIAIVGPGRLGAAMATSLKRSGYRIAEVISRKERKSFAAARRLARRVGARLSQSRAAQLGADLIWFCVPDSKIAEAAREFSDREWKGKIAMQSSGVLTSEALQLLQERGASLASVHPLMTFVRDSVPDLSGVTFAVEGDPRAVRVARRIVRDLGGEMLLLRKQDKPAYHAFATMICPLLIGLLASAERAAVLAGITRTQARRRMLPIIHQTLHNYATLGPDASFTGPIVRGDSQTVGRHLEALKRVPPVQTAYSALAQATLEYLPSRNRRELDGLLRAVK